MHARPSYCRCGDCRAKEREAALFEVVVSVLMLATFIVVALLALLVMR